MTTQTKTPGAARSESINLVAEIQPVIDRLVLDATQAPHEVAAEQYELRMLVGRTRYTIKCLKTEVAILARADGLLRRAKAAQRTKLLTAGAREMRAATSWKPCVTQAKKPLKVCLESFQYVSNLGGQRVGSEEEWANHREYLALFE